MSLSPSSDQQSTCPGQGIATVSLSTLEERVETIEDLLRNVTSELSHVNHEFRETWEKINTLQEIMKLQQSIILLMINVYAYNVTGEYYINPSVNDNSYHRTVEAAHNVVRIGEGVHQVVQYTDARLKELERTMTNRGGNSRQQDRPSHMYETRADNTSMILQNNGSYTRIFDSNKCPFRSNADPTNENNTTREKSDFSRKELERLGIQQQEYQPTERNLERLKDFRQNKTNEQQYELEHKLQAAEELEAYEKEDDNERAKASKSPEYEEDLDEEEGIESEEDQQKEEKDEKRSIGSGDTSGPDSPHEEEEYEDYKDEEKGEQPQKELKPEDIVPGIPSIPIFRYDSTTVAAYEAYEKELPKEDPGIPGGPLGSKWKLVKALKERKAEEKEKAETPTPVTTTATVSTTHCILFIMYR
ncbi:hypothetical protein WDU94_010511 [Cyamophila willieti]